MRTGLWRFLEILDKGPELNTKNQTRTAGQPHGKPAGMPDSSLGEFAEDFMHRSVKEFLFASGHQLQDGCIVIKVDVGIHITGTFFVQTTDSYRSVAPRSAKLLQDNFSLNVGQDDVLNVSYVGGG